MSDPNQQPNPEPNPMPPPHPPQPTDPGQQPGQPQPNPSPDTPNEQTGPGKEAAPAGVVHHIGPGEMIISGRADE